MNKEKQQGITLIALIITIIVILILVAVTVRTVANSGLFDHAKNATNKWATEQDRESNIGDEVDQIIKEQVGIHNWIRNGDNIHCNHCGLSFVIGDFLDYQPDPTSKTITISETESGLADRVEIGGYLDNSNVKLATMKNTDNQAEIKQVDSVEPDESDNIFTQNAETYWQVLGVEDSDGNGTNETLLIRLAYGTEEGLTLCGAAAYNNGPDIMNRICKELYSSSKYGQARSIKIEDVNNTLGYKPKGGMFIGETMESSYEMNGFNTQVKDLQIWNEVKLAGTNTPDGTNTESKLGSYKVDGYLYMLEVEGRNMSNSLEKPNGSKKIARMSLTNEKQATITRTGSLEIPTYLINPITENRTKTTENAVTTIFDSRIFWLATRGTLAANDGGISGTTFGAGMCGDGLVISAMPMYASINEFNARTRIFSLCPVIPLRNEIPPKTSRPR